MEKDENMELCVSQIVLEKKRNCSKNRKDWSAHVATPDNQVERGS